MAFIHDNHNAFIVDKFYILAVHVAVIIDVAHLLNGRYNQRISGIGTLQLGNQYIRVFRCLYCFIIVGKIAVF